MRIIIHIYLWFNSILCNVTSSNINQTIPLSKINFGISLFEHQWGSRHRERSTIILVIVTNDMLSIMNIHFRETLKQVCTIFYSDTYWFCYRQIRQTVRQFRNKCIKTFFIFMCHFLSSFLFHSNYSGRRPSILYSFSYVQ